MHNYITTVAGSRVAVENEDEVSSQKTNKENKTIGESP